MTTQYYVAASLDGFIATEDDGLDWLLALGQGVDTGYAGFIAQVGALAMGAGTYRWLLTHAAAVEAETGSRWPYGQPTWVFTHQHVPRIEGADIRWVQGDVRSAHDEMLHAAGERNVWIVGGGDLAAQFHDAGRLDEVIVHVASVTLGRGKPLFPRRAGHPAWTLRSVRQLGTHFAELRYDLRPDDVPAASGAPQPTAHRHEGPYDDPASP